MSEEDIGPGFDSSETRFMTRYKTGQRFMTSILYVLYDAALEQSLGLHGLCVLLAEELET